MTRKLSLLLAAFMLLTVALTTAYFTDRVTGNGSISTTDNSVDIDIDKPDVPDPDVPDPDPDGNNPFTPDPDPDNDLTEWWTYLNATALANYNPGDKIALDAKLTNSGTLDVDYRQTFVVTSSVPMTDGALEFELFSASNKETYGAWTGVSKVAGFAIDTTKSTATKTVYSVAPAKLAVGATITPDYDLIFNKAASNAFQGATVTVEYLVEARQANAAGADADWATVATGTVTIGGETVSAVPKA